MKIDHKILFDCEGTFQQLLEIWSCFHQLLVKEYDWQELPQKFDLADCLYTEYEEVPYATVHIYRYNHDISFQKGKLKVDINMEDDDIYVNYYIAFTNQGDTSHNFSFNSQSKEFTCNINSPFYNQLIKTVHSIPKLEEMTPFEVRLTKPKGLVDALFFWNWMRGHLSKIYKDILLPETITLTYSKENKEHAYELKTDTFQIGIFSEEDTNKIYFFFKHNTINSTLLLNTSLQATNFKLSYDNPNKDLWIDAFNHLDF